MTGRSEPLETFVRVPTFVHAALGEGRLTPTGLALYVVLRSYRNSRNGGAWPSLASLAKAMNMKNPKNLVKYIKELRAIGAIVPVSNPRVLSVTYMFPENSPTETVASAEEVLNADIIEETGTSADTGTSGSTGTGWGDEYDPFAGTTGTSGDTNPVPVEVPTGTSGDTATGTSGDTQTRLTEPDRGTRKIERLADASRTPLRAADAGWPKVQPPLMQSVPTSGPSLAIGQQPRLFLEAKLGRELHESEEALAAKLDAKGNSRTSILIAIQGLRIPA